MTEFRKNTSHAVTIDGYTNEGAGVARLDGLVVFIPGTIRGERWEILLLKVNKNVAWGKAVTLLEASPERVEEDCPHAGKCGGCQYRHMSYGEECVAKGQRVADAMLKVGGIEYNWPAVLGADQPDRYRNKVQFPVASGAGGGSIGFFRPRSHDVIDVEDCLLQPQSASKIRAEVKRWMMTYNIPAYDEKTKKGLVRHLYLRTNHRGQVLVCLVVNGNKLPEERNLVAWLQAVEPNLVGVMYNINKQDTNVILGRKYRLIWGHDFLEENLMGLTFKLSVPSFFQINRVQTEKLYAKAVEFAGLTGTETVLDLYCGIGTISLCMAQKAGKVVGCEIIPEAIEDAQQNADRNGIENVDFYCGDAGEVAAQLSTVDIRPDVIVVDPPRKGLAPEVPEILANIGAEKIVYVSCDPATLARDVKKFTELGYHFVKGQGVDMFPRTVHVETVILLEKFGK